MPRLWLPMGRPATTPPKDERDELLRRLRRIGVLVAGGDDPNLVEISQLREIVHWQEERYEAQRKIDLLTPEPRRLPREHVRQMLHDYLDYKRVRDAGARRLY